MAISKIILGAGPTGLGAAMRLEENRHADWQLLEGPVMRAIQERDEQTLTLLGGLALFESLARGAVVLRSAPCTWCVP